MKNIISVFKADARRISKNVIALIIIIGVSVIPCLYAWFNILSNWDPYGADATSNLRIAVVSEDEGREFLDFSLNVGEKLIAELQANKDVGWAFPETEEAALEGVYSGEYYAAFVVPADFSEDMMSFLSGEPGTPEIAFYANAKKNAIATKITSKVKTTIQRKINEAFIGVEDDATIVEAIKPKGAKIKYHTVEETVDYVKQMMDQVAEATTAIGINAVD